METTTQPTEDVKQGTCPRCGNRRTNWNPRDSELYCVDCGQVTWSEPKAIPAPAPQGTPKDYIWHGGNYHLKGVLCNQCAPQEAPAQQELSPCPFCGQSPTVGLLDEDGGVHLDRIIAECKECGFYLSVIDKDCDNLLTLKPQLIAKWNARYRDPAFQKLHDALANMCDKFYPHQCKFHGPAVCDRCEALRQASEALRLAREGEE